jgi:hypothetical protein
LFVAIAMIAISLPPLAPSSSPQPGGAAARWQGSRIVIYLDPSVTLQQAQAVDASSPRGRSLAVPFRPAQAALARF